MDRVFDPDAALLEARSFGLEDRDAAVELLRSITHGEPCIAWAEAHLDLAAEAFGRGDLPAVEEHSHSVLAAAADATGVTARGLAGVLHSDARNLLDKPVDEHLLRESIDACVTANESYYAAVGLSLLARLREASDRSGASALLEESAALYDRSGSMLGGPSVRLRLAKLEMADNRVDAARAHLERGIAHLRTFPYGGFQVRALEGQLTSYLHSLEGPPQ